jgi:predicted DNA-binding protein YlxM (UPF0122 family)
MLSETQASLVRLGVEFFREHNRLPSLGELAHLRESSRTSIHGLIARIDATGLSFSQRLRMQAPTADLKPILKKLLAHAGGNSGEPIKKLAELLLEATKKSSGSIRAMGDLSESETLALARSSLIEVYELLWPLSLEEIRSDSNTSSKEHRRKEGVFLTPVWLAFETVWRTASSYLLGIGVSEAAVKRIAARKKFTLKEADRDHLERFLTSVSVVDPACGVGTFLYATTMVFDHLRSAYLGPDKLDKLISDLVLNRLHGADKNPDALHLARLLLRSVSGEASPNLHLGDALTAPLLPVGPRPEGAVDWNALKPGGFELVVGNPPWERLKLMSREFFELTDPDLAQSATSAERRTMLEGRTQRSLALREAKESIASYVRQLRTSGSYRHSLSGEPNLYSLFLERASHLLSPDGQLGLLVPSGLATDKRMAPLFASLADTGRLRAFLDFENRKKIFEAVDGRQKFAMVIASKRPAHRPAQFAFFLHTREQLGDTSRSFTMTSEERRRINPHTGAAPVCRSQLDYAAILRTHKTLPVLGSPDSGWRFEYRRQVDMSSDSGQFVSWDSAIHELEEGGVVVGPQGRLLRLFEGRMIGQYDHRSASSVNRIGRYRRPASSSPTTMDQYTDPSFSVTPRYLVKESFLRSKDSKYAMPSIGFMDIGSATNRRTMIACMMPLCASGNKVPLLRSTDGHLTETLALLAILNSYAFDYCLRQHIGGISINKFILEQCPVVPKDTLTASDFQAGNLLDWLAERARYLTISASDIGSHLDEGAQDVQVWNPAGRRRKRVEIDALMFLLYGYSISEVARVMDTFHIVKKEEERSFGKYLLAEEIQVAMRSVEGDLDLCSQ